MSYLIPNYVVRKSEKDTLINEMLIDDIISERDNNKVLLIFMYMHSNTTQSNNINFALKDMICECGFKPRSGKGNINEVFKTILNYLNKKGYFGNNDIDFMNIKVNQFIKVNNNYFDTNEEGNKINYFILDDEEIEDIYNINNVDSKKLLLYYSTLKSRIYNSIDVSDEKAKVCYATVEDMSKDIALSKDTINQYNQILVDNDLIYIDNAGKFSKINNGNRIYKQSANTYTLTSINNYKVEVDKSIDMYINYMKKLNWNLCEDTTLTQNQLVGTINRLEYLEQQGKLSDENKVKLDKAKEMQNIVSDTNKYDNQQLLDQHPDMLLSEIFLDMNMDELSRKYQDTEFNLGLIDEDFNLLVDKDYYKWVIVNYNKSKHDYYKNCIAKKIKEVNPGTTDEQEHKGYFGKPKHSNESGEIIENDNWNDEEVDINDVIGNLFGVDEEESIKMTTINAPKSDTKGDNIELTSSYDNEKDTNVLKSFRSLSNIYKNNEKEELEKVKQDFAKDINISTSAIDIFLVDIEEYLNSEDFTELTLEQKKEQMKAIYQANRFEIEEIERKQHEQKKRDEEMEMCVKNYDNNIDRYVEDIFYNDNRVETDDIDELFA